jgi:hypothetical protein
MSDDTNEIKAGDNAPGLLTLLESVDNGEPLRTAEEMLREIVAESHIRGGKGELSLTFKLETSISRGTPKTEVRIEVKGKAPKVPAGASTFFATADGGLQRDDPAQLELQEGMGKNVVKLPHARRGAKAAAKAPAKEPAAAAAANQ